MAKKTGLAQKELAKETTELLKGVLLCVSKKEQELEVLRQFLCTNMNFEPYSSFQRLDRNEDGFLQPLDFLNFLRENGITEATEADCYYIVKFFDADEDGKLSYPEYLQIILPCLNHKLRASTTQRPVQFCKPQDYLAIDVEQDLSRLFKKEVDMHVDGELLK